jgi:LysR family transcriptional regulator, transcriptional activator of the cysJI operon
MIMDERRLQIFKAVADLRNFSRAAEVLHLSQPTVSQQIQGLEEYYGTKLFDRTSKSVELTAAGRALYASLLPMLQQFAEVRRAVMRSTGAVSGPLTVGASLTIGEYVLPQVLAAYLREYPGVEASVQINNTEQIVALMLSGALDIGLLEGPVQAPEMVEEVFLEDELVLVAPGGHPWRERAAITLEDLQAERLVMRERGSGTRHALEERLQAAGVRLADLQVAAELAGTEAIKGAVEAGLGVAALSRWTVRKELRLGTLLARRIPSLPIRRTFRAVYPRGRTLVPTAAALLAHLHAFPF